MDVITLSSEDESTSSSSAQPPRKRMKLELIPSKTICLDSSDEENESETSLTPKANGISTSAVAIKHASPVHSLKESALIRDKDDEIALQGTTVDEEVVSPPEVENEPVDIIEQKLSQFLDKCLKTANQQRHQDLINKVIPKFKIYYQKLKKLNYNLKEFECVLDRDNNVIYDCPTASLRFEQIFRYLKGKIVESEKVIKLSGPKKQHVKKLEKALALVRRRIAKLDQAEVDFENEENSCYLQAAKYKERAMKIYQKICQLRKEDPNNGHPLYMKTNFSSSRYPQFNKVINRRFKDFHQFPTYCDMDQCIRKCVADKGIEIPEERLKEEIKFCFEKLGKLMKQKRSLDLHNVHSDFITGTEDPAESNEDISNKLRENSIEGARRMEAVLEKYTRMQESGVDPDVTSDSDDSHRDSD